MRGVVAGAAAVVAIAAVCVFVFSGEDAAPAEKAEKKAEKIKEVTPAPAPKAGKATERPKREKPKKSHYWEQPTTNGLSGCQILKWKHVRVKPPSYTNDAFRMRPKSEYEIFDTRAENEIAMLMAVPPGTEIVGSPDYGEAFRKEFLKSCETPIVVSDDDTEYQKQLKQDMIQMKAELRQRMADGEDICEIMAESRLEMRRLNAIKEQIEQGMRELMKDAQSEEDVDDTIRATNKLLEQHGIAPIKSNPLVKRMVRKRMMGAGASGVNK